MVAAKTIRIGIVGLGFGTYGLLPAFRLDSRCEVTALCSTDETKARAAAKAHGVPHAFGDYRELIASGSVDAIAIATSPDAQEKIAAAALAAGIAVFCEKPMALSLEAAQKIADAANESRTPAMIDLLFPEIPAWIEGRRRVTAGELGVIRHAFIRWSLETHDIRTGISGWKTDASMGGGVISHFAPHAFYYLECFLGEISSVAAVLGNAPDLDRPGDTFASVGIEFKSGATAALNLCSAAPFSPGHRFEIHGSKGSLLLENNTRDHIRGFRLLVGKRGALDLTEIQFPAVPSVKADVDGRVEPVSQLVKRFLDWIETGKPAKPDLADGLRTQMILDAVKRSHTSGRRIKI